MNKRIWVVLVAALALLSVGCPSKPASEQQAQSVTVGIMTPLTGEVASWGDMQRKATELALADLKAKGALEKLDVRVIYEDDKASPKDGVNAFRKLADVDRVPIVVGSPASTVTLAVAPIANEKKVVLLSSGSTATDVGKAGPYVFRIMPSDEVQASIMADWALELGYKKIAVIFVENAWGRGLVEQFKADYTKKGGSIVADESSKPDTTDYRAQLTKTKEASPDAIYAPLYTRGAGLMIRQARELGLRCQVLGADVYETPELVEAGGKAVDGVLYTTYGQYSGQEFQFFANRYKAKYGRDPEIYARYCYDAFCIAIAAVTSIPQAKPIDGPNVREALLTLKDFHGVSGVTTFDGRNSATGRTFDKMMVTNGHHVPFDPKARKDILP